MAIEYNVSETWKQTWHENLKYTGGHKSRHILLKTLYKKRFLIFQKLSLVCLISASARHKGRKFTTIAKNQWFLRWPLPLQCIDGMVPAQPLGPMVFQSANHWWQFFFQWLLTIGPTMRWSSVNKSTIDIRYQYIEQGYAQCRGKVMSHGTNKLHKPNSIYSCDPISETSINSSQICKFANNVNKQLQALKPVPKAFILKNDRPGDDGTLRSV